MTTAPDGAEVASVRVREELPASHHARRELAIVVTTLFLLPLLFMVMGSLRGAGLPPPRGADLLPIPPVFGNYPRTYDLVDIPRYTLNSFFVAAIATPLAVLVASWAGFSLAQLPKRLAGRLVGASLVALMIPVTALLVGRFTLMRSLSLTGTYAPLIANALIATSPFLVLLLYWSFRRVPRELYESCRLEGMGPLQTWWAIAPLVRPVTVAVAVLAFAATWSDFLHPLVYLTNERSYTLPLGMRALAELDRKDFPLVLAGAVTATAPVVLAFLVAQRSFLGRLRDASGRS